MKDVALGGIGLALCTASEHPLAAAEDAAAPADTTPLPGTNLAWLGGVAPFVPAGVTWGVPWARGVVPHGSEFTVRNKDGIPLPTQSWPLAFWPDGSIKWTGLAISADAQLASPLTVAVGSSPAPQMPLTIKEASQSIEVLDGAARLPDHPNRRESHRFALH